MILYTITKAFMALNQSEWKIASCSISMEAEAASEDYLPYLFLLLDYLYINCYSRFRATNPVLVLMSALDELKTNCTAHEVHNFSITKQVMKAMIF